MATIAELYDRGVTTLQAAGIEDAPLETSFFLAEILGLSRAQIFLRDNSVAVDHEHLFDSYLTRRCRHEPFAYIVGHQEFWGLDFAVSPAVLIPRPETELLVEEVLAHITGRSTFSGVIVDLGTGSGILPVSLAHELPHARFVALDLSLDALQIARRNCITHGHQSRIALLAADFLKAFNRKGQFDFIVANPPYVKRATFAELQPDVVDYEPHLALDGGGKDGLALIRRFAPDIADHLRPGGWFVMEIGADQKKAILQLFAGFASYDHLAVLDDYAGLPRLLTARRRP